MSYKYVILIYGDVHAQQHQFNMKPLENSAAKISDLLRRLEDLRKDNKVCLLNSKEIIEKTKNLVLRNSKLL